MKSGTTDFGKFTYTKRGGWVTGDLVDGGNPAYPLKKPFSSAPGSKVDLYSADGTPLASGFSDDNGHFAVQGQISSQTGATLVITTRHQSGGYMNGEGYCQFDEASVEAVSITIGRETAVGTIDVPRHP